MAGTSNTYHTSLNALKPILPKGYQEKTLKKLTGFTLNQIKGAFSGRLKDQEKLKIILQAAQKVAKEYKNDKQRMMQETITILQGATGLACIFFALF